MSTPTGVKVHEDCITEYLALQKDGKYTYIQYKISPDKTTIVVDKAVPSSTFNEFVNDLPKEECRYITYDFEYKLSDTEGTRKKIIFITWYGTPYYFRIPENAKPIASKMIYSASKSAIRQTLSGIAADIQVNDINDLSYGKIVERLQGHKVVGLKEPAN